MLEVAQHIDAYRVFLSSPSDMDQEREEVRRFFKSLNQSIAQLFSIRFEVIDWENCTDIGFDNPQDLITRQTLERFSDSLVLVIGLMGQRFGTPTGSFESGTQAEFEWAATHKRKHGYPEIKWFFRRIDQFVAPSETIREIQDAVKQWKRVKRFRREYEGLYKEFPNTASFPDVLREDLSRWFASWIVSKRTINSPGTPIEMTNPPKVPDFLDNRMSRTLRIVTALEDMAHDVSQYGEPCIRICALMSSLAITEQHATSKPGDEEYHQLIERERNLIEQLFERAISLRVLLTWNINEMLEWEGRNRNNVLARLSKLKAFCKKVLESDSRLKRARFVHIGIRERNLLFLGKKYLFEGRKLSTKPGFEATQVITSKGRIYQEIEMFDILFNNAVKNELPNIGTQDLADRNRELLVSLVRRIEKDVKRLKETRDHP